MSGRDGEMSAWVLVIVIYFAAQDRAPTAVAIDMPDMHACYLALNKAMDQRDVRSAFCLERKQ